MVKLNTSVLKERSEVHLKFLEEVCTLGDRMVE